MTQDNIRLQENIRLRTNSGSVSGHRFSDAICSSKSKASLGAAIAMIMALLFSTYAFADSGPDIYKAKCSACHGSNGAGETMLGKNLKLRSLASAEVQKQSDDDLARITAKGRNKMPSYDRKLSKDQIQEVVKYIRSLKK
jgi:mono/diheme cytochrome c family protein